MLRTTYLILLLMGTHFSLFTMQLQGLRLIQRRFEQLSAHIFRPGHVHVFMNDTKAIALAADVKKNVTISTAGLIGCMATVFYAKDKQEGQQVILMHYHPNYHKEHVIELKYQIDLLINTSFKITKHLCIMPSESYFIDNISHRNECNQKRKEIEDTVQKLYGRSNIPMLCIPYDLPPDGKGYFAQVHVTLSNTIPSKCKVIQWTGAYECELE